VICDISEFYPRLNHHRLDNALRQLRVPGDQPFKIMEFLANFSQTYSFGIPVGGPAARILSELVLNQIDQLLRIEGIKFCRFADDFHLFCDSYQDAFRALLFLSESLVQNQGLQLQKAKTRIMSGAEFAATNPFFGGDDEVEAEAEAPTVRTQAQNLMRLSLRFDPYSPTAADDFEALRAEIDKVDIVGLLKSELVKSRVHISLTRKIITAMKYVDPARRDDAVLSLIENDELLYPVYSNVLFVAKSLYPELSPPARVGVISHVRRLIRDKSYLMQVDLNLSYAVRLIASSGGPENEQLLNAVYKHTNSVGIRRDIILAMARWNRGIGCRTSSRISALSLLPSGGRLSLRPMSSQMRDRTGAITSMRSFRLLSISCDAGQRKR
jgi:hypothetical protein